MALPSFGLETFLSGEGTDAPQSLCRASSEQLQPRQLAAPPMALTVPGCLPLSVLNRASSMDSELQLSQRGCGPGGGRRILDRLDQGCSASSINLSASLDGARRLARKQSSAETQAQLARAIDTLTHRLEDLGRYLDSSRSANDAAQSKLFDFIETQVAATPSPRTSTEDLHLIGELQASLGLQRSWLEAEAAAAAAARQRAVEAHEVQAKALMEFVRTLQAHENQTTAAVENTPVRPDPRYRPFVGSDDRLYEFPEVQIGLKVYQVGNVNTAQMTFEIDFICHLDWCDPNVEGVPCDQLRNLDWSRYFNPRVEIDNGKDSSGWMPGADEVPRRRGFNPGGDYCSRGGRSRSHSSDSGGDPTLDDPLGPWLRKTARFRGTLSLNSVNLRCFPFDIQVLPIKLKAARCRGLDIGTPVFDLNRHEHSHRVRLVDEGRLLQDRAYKASAAHLRARGHFALPAADEASLEFDISGITGYHPIPQRSDVYEVHILVERPKGASYVWDILIMNLLVCLSATAFWDTAAPELSSRMSISLTVILTLAAYTSARPAPIEKAPYVTFHDWCEQVCMFLVTGISLQNVYAVVMCGGQHEEAPSYMTEMFEKNIETCSEGWCLSRQVDCRGLVILLVTWLALYLYSLVWLVRTRRATQGFWSRMLSSTCIGHHEPRSDCNVQTCRGLRWSFVRNCCAACACRPCRRYGQALAASEVEALAQAPAPPNPELHPVGAVQLERCAPRVDSQQVWRSGNRSPTLLSTSPFRPRPQELTFEGSDCAESVGSERPGAMLASAAAVDKVAGDYDALTPTSSNRTVSVRTVCGTDQCDVRPPSPASVRVSELSGSNRMGRSYEQLVY